LPAYEPALSQLQDLDLLYPCSCTRKDIQAAITAPQEGAIPDVYPGTCKSRPVADWRPGDALRLQLDRALALFKDDLPQFIETGPNHRGVHTISSAHAIKEIGDVVMQRKEDDIIAYFLASALDDTFQRISDVVRGEDLFNFTPIQVILLALLDHPIPTYHHHQLVRDENGKRLAKRDDARAISLYRREGATPKDVRSMIGL
jgi:glutamyl-Q tRNA(Asp) synthetase